jgi:hypothetical protein
MDHKTELQFQQLCTKLGDQFGGDMDINAVLFLIGVQELGKGYRKFSKDEKMNLIHIAICTILEPYGIYKFRETDPDGWPHFDKVQGLPPISVREQESLLKEASVNYFQANGIVKLD